MFRKIRTFSSFSHHLFRPRSSLLQHDGAVTIKRVRILRPVFTPKRAQTAALWATGFVVYWYILGSVEDKEEGIEQAAEHVHEMRKADENGEPAGAEGEEAEEDVAIPDEPPEDAWFIPLGWARPRPRVLYKASDPEWQSFVAFSQDIQKGLALRNELAGMVCKHIASMKGFQMALGTPIQIQRYWLDTDFPDSPPPEYERGGIEITEDYIAWAVRPVHPINLSRLHAALWPKPMMWSFWASYNVLWSLQVAKIKGYFNIKPEPASAKQNMPAGYIDFHRLTQDKETSGATAVEDSSESKTPALTPPAPRSSAPRSDGAKVLRVLPAVPQPGEEMSSAMKVFKRTLAKTWRPASAPAPRGTFMVSGLVQVGGPRGHCVFDIHAAYHPAESRWVAVVIDVRRIQQRVQGPKGGQ